MGVRTEVWIHDGVIPQCAASHDNETVLESQETPRLVIGGVGG